MSLNSFDRNYGMSANSREFWGGDNGFVTVVVTLPTDVEIGVSAVAFDGTEAGDNAAQTAKSAAEKNQFIIAQALAQRAVLVTTSALSNTIDPTASGFGTVGGNVIAYGSAGTLAANSFGITYIVERQDVFTKQVNKPGSTYALTVDPTVEIATNLAQAGVFQKKDGTPAAAAAVAIKVFAALPVLV
jgi:1-aminocyclopropane-1-carboxylate deaminase/D-cysteine desulfhydrase-like pyridoxal-dependent ACC family enzyme